MATQTLQFKIDEGLERAFEKLAVGPPELGTFPVSFVVQFFDGTGKFYCQIDELCVPNDYVLACAAGSMRLPVRLTTRFDTVVELDDADDAAAAAAGSASAAIATALPAAVVQGDTFEPSSGDLPVCNGDSLSPISYENDDLPPEFGSDDSEDTDDGPLPDIPLERIPRRGTCAVIAVLSANCTVFVGLVSEPYDLDNPLTEQEISDGAAVAKETKLNKRVPWCKGRPSKLRRAETSGEADAADAVADPDVVPTDNSGATWENATRTELTRCRWWLDPQTGNLQSIELLVHMESRMVLDTFEMALAQMTS